MTAKKTTEEKSKMGRPRAFSNKESVLIKNLVKKNIRVKDIAEILECAESTLYDYVSKQHYFSEAYKEGREELIESLECALYKKALGYEVEEEHVANGVVTKTKRQFAPDTGAIIFALSNLTEQRKNKKITWCNKRYNDNKVTGTITVDEKKRGEISDRFSRYGGLLSCQN